MGATVVVDACPPIAPMPQSCPVPSTQACASFQSNFFSAVAVYLSVKQFVCCRMLDMVGNQWLGEGEASVSACDWMEQHT